MLSEKRYLYRVMQTFGGLNYLLGSCLYYKGNIMQVNS